MSEYALWLMPDHTNMKKFRSVISGLAEEHLSEIFEPHVTLLQIKEPSIEDAVEKARKLAGEIRPFDLKLEKADHEDYFFRCVIVRAEKSRELMAARKRAAEIFGINAPEYSPHMSLLYGDVPKKSKEEIIAKLGDVSASVKAQSLWLVKNDRPGTKTTRYWHIEAKIPLA